MADSSVKNDIAIMSMSKHRQTGLYTLLTRRNSVDKRSNKAILSPPMLDISVMSSHFIISITVNR